MTETKIYLTDIFVRDDIKNMYSNLASTKTFSPGTINNCLVRIAAFRKFQHVSLILQTTVFSKSQLPCYICPKVNVIVRLEFKFTTM